MNKENRIFEKELKKYIKNTREVRQLSSVHVAKLKNSQDYVKTLHNNFLRIKAIAAENRTIIADVLEPVLSSKERLDDDQVKILTEFKQELINAWSVENLDLPIVAITVRRLYQDAVDKGKLSYMIEQLDSQIEIFYALSCYAARVTDNQSIALEYINRVEAASERFADLVQKENFMMIDDEDSRDIVLINYRYRSSIYEPICGNEAINEKAVKQYADALNLLDDPFYREQMPDYDWDYYEFRSLEYASMMSEGRNRRGYSKEQLQFAYDCSERYGQKWDSDPELFSEYTAKNSKNLTILRNRYMSGRIDRVSYKKGLLDIYSTRRETVFKVDDVYTNILIPIEYLIISKEDGLPEEDKHIVFDMCQNLLSYAHNTTNSGELTVILNYYYVFLQGFAEVSDKFTLEDMCLESFAALHPPTYIHSNMVAQISKCLCTHLLEKSPGLFVGVLGCADADEVVSRKEDIISRIYHGALVHDVGKLAIIDTIFVYGRNLTDEEFKLIRMHPEAGYYLAGEGTALSEYKDIIVSHHRFYDEKGGYPPKTDDVVSPDKMLIDIVTVADCMDAATDTVGRSYTQGKTLSQFVEELNEGAGTRYSPDVAELFSDSAVCDDVNVILTEGRDRIYTDTYHLLKSVHEHGLKV